MVPIEDLINSNTTPRQWIQYYKNIWTRNIIAKVIDIQGDIARKAKDPEDQVEHDEMRGAFMAVKERLEMRKAKLLDWKEILDNAEKLLKMSDEEIAKLWSPEALAVAPDMIPKPEEKKPEDNNPKTTVPTPPPAPATPPTPPSKITKK